MGKLMMEEVIGHCERTVERFEKQMSREALEKRPIEEIFMKEYWEHRQVAEWLEELQAFKDKQEQGLLISLPCKVGDTVYLLERFTVARRTEILKCNVDEFTVTTSGCYAVLNGNESYYALRRFRAVKIEDFGETVFLTRSEAEEALAKMGGAHETRH